MLRWLQVLTVGALFGFAAVAPTFVYFWYDHTLWVQEMVSERFDEFRERDIDWSMVDPVTDPNFDPERFRLEVRLVAISAISLWGAGPISEDRQDYIGALADLQGALLQTPDATFNLGHLVTEAADAQAELYEVIERFTGSTLYAMRFTF